MKHGIVPGEPGIFPAPFAKWYAKVLGRWTKKPAPQAPEDTPAAGTTDERQPPPAPPPSSQAPEPPA